MGMSKHENVDASEDGCVVHSHPVPPSELKRYGVDRDADSEQDIARYVEIEASDEAVQHVEKVKREIVLGDVYDVWDVTTDCTCLAPIPAPMRSNAG